MFDYFVISLIFGSKILSKDGILQLFIAVIILGVGGIIALAVLSKKQDGAAGVASKTEDGMITITKTEYNELKAKIASLEEELKTFKK